MNNLVSLVGHVGQAPTAVSFKDSENKVVKFSIAVKEYSSKTEEEKTMWVDVDAWNGLGQRVLDTFTQGREVVVVGRLAISEYTKEINGVKVKLSKPLIKLTSFHLCGKKPVSDGEATSEKATESKKRKLTAVSG